MDDSESSNVIDKHTMQKQNNHSEPVLNGMSNGLGVTTDDHHHKHKHKDKEKDRDKEKRHKHKDKDRDSEKHSHSSSKEKSKDGEKQKDKEHRDKHKDHRNKEKDKDRHSKDKEHRSKDEEHHNKEHKEHKDKHKDSREKHKDKEYHKNSKDKEHKSSSKHAEGGSNIVNEKSSSKEKQKHHNSSKERDGKEKHSSSSSSKHEKKHSSHGDRHSSKHHSSEKSSSSEKKHSDQTKEKRKEKHRDKEKKEKERENKEKPGTPNIDLSTIKTEDCFDSVAVKEEEIYSDSYMTSFNNTSYRDMKTDFMIKLEPVDVKQEMTDDASEEAESTEGDSEVKTEQENDYGNDDEDDDDIPLAKRTSASLKAKRQIFQEDDSDDDVPLMSRKKVKKEKESENVRKRKKEVSGNESGEDYKPAKKHAKVEKARKEADKKIKTEQTDTPTKRKKEEEEQEIWKWWEEEKKDDGIKWKFLEHKGPCFAPPYEPLPPEIKFYYDGKEMKLSENAEEVATFYARMIEHEYTTKEVFNKNFFKDWRKVMTSKEREIITDLKKCDFKKMHAYFVQKSEERKAMSKEEKKKLKEQNEAIANEFGFCVIDGHKEKIGNFKIEPPGLFRGRGEHPKMGMLKKRVMPEDVIINCSKDSKVPTPPKGHKWREVRHDNSVTWLASWTENVQGQVKYVMLNPSSKLKGEKDWQKYEIARKLAKSVDKIRREYREDWKSKEMRVRQRAVALYFIDRLALRAGNEKDEDQADTVGCCSLRVEHIQLHEQKDGKEYVVVFDFPGKDSIRYYNEVPVEKRVFKNLQLFCERKKGSNDLFDRLNTAVLNKHLNELMEGLTAKVFRTYNASYTLQNQLNELTDPNASVAEKILQYNRANRAVAILCNHQRSIPKSHEKSMGTLKQKIDAKKEQIEIATRQYKDAKREARDGSAQSKIVLEKKKKALDRLKEQLVKLEVQETDKEENKTIALSTSKLNYLDPRISVAWCKKYGVPIEKIYNKTQRSKFRWAIDMAGPDYVF